MAAQFSYKNDADEDQRASPSQNAKDLQQAEQAAAFENEFGSDNYQKDGVSGDLSGGVREKEAVGNEGNLYKPSGTPKKERATFKGLIRRKGPLAAIIAFLVGGGAGFSILFAPGLGIVHLKETLVDDLNDQVSSMSIRSDYMFKAKLKGLQAGGSVCSAPIKIRCKFTTMNDKQITKFRNAGFTVETQDKLFGRKTITGLSIIDSKTKAVIQITNPQDLINQRKNPAVASALKRVYSPLLAGTSDGTAQKVYNDKKTGTGKKLTGVTQDALDEEFNKAVAGDSAVTNDIVRRSSDGRQYVFDEKGKRVYSNASNYETEKAKAIERNSAIVTEANKAKETGLKATTGVLSAGAKGVLLTGFADSACTVYNTARAVSAAAKNTRSLQLIQYSMVFLNVADSIKAGEATPEQVEYLGNKLTATDTRETITNETSASEGTGSQDTVQTILSNTTDVKNPFYGKNAFDSPGYKTAAYNDAPVLTTQSQQYMVGGGLSGSLSEVTESVASIIGGNPDNLSQACGIIQSPWVRGVGLVAGIAVGIGTFGTGTAISIGASVAIGFALPFLTAALADIVAGQVVNKDTKGVEAGDAIFAGTGALMGSLAQARGLKPLNKTGLQQYLATTEKVKSEAIALETNEAKDTPFDIMNQYSFLGSFARSVNTTFLEHNTVNSSLTGLTSFVGSSFTSLLPSAKAMLPYNEARFSQCNDTAYESIGIDAADVFCNIRYGLSDVELALDPETVLDYMLNNNYITPGGAPSGIYTDFMKNCVNRQDGWGETSEENGSTGKECLQDTFGGVAQTSYFRVYTLDKTLSDGMDDEYEDESEAETPIANGEVVSPVSNGPGFDLRDGFGPRVSPGGGVGSTWHQGLDMDNSKDHTVLAFRDGVVASINLGDRNHPVIIRHADGLQSEYLHMKSQDIVVRVGDVVTAGQKIGVTGCEGSCTGRHLHFSLIISGVNDMNVYAEFRKSPNGSKIDPKQYLQKYGVVGF